MDGTGDIGLWAALISAILGLLTSNPLTALLGAIAAIFGGGTV